MKLGSLKIPTINTITGRSSAIRASFIKSVIPTILPVDEILRDKLLDENFTILSHTENGKYCAYCAISLASEWDHFNPVVNNKKPTKYVTDIYNLVPSCGKCNQSKGGKHWREWITSTAILSPATRKIENLEAIIKNLEVFEKWSNDNTYKLSDEEMLSMDDFMKDCQEIISKMYEYQEKANAIKANFIENAVKKMNAKIKNVSY
jgi:hypothetical protein